MTLDTNAIARVVAISATSFGVAIVVMPVWIRLLQRWKMGKSIRDEASAPVMSKLHAHKAGTPTMGGLVIWLTPVIMVLVYRAACFFTIPIVCRLSFLSRAQTRLPLGILAAAGLIGLVDDYLNVRRIGPRGGGLRMRFRLLSYAFVALAGAYWFFSRLEWDFVHVPFMGTFNIGWWYVPFFVLVVVATSFSVNETDGLDGLAGGPLMTSFGAMALIAWSQGRIDLAALCVAILGSLLAFLWYNVPPAKVYMGDTGAMALGTVLASVAMITNTALLLPLIGFPFVVESLSVMAQVASKRLTGKKLFRSSPLHHHLEAIGWPESQIVMRTWIVSFMFAALGVIVAFIDPTR
ncbi:phospho-N-acetylmuramoyl-pentapeptide-transferase [Candidatus Uhrbacteria bacterium RIFCSPHIGHO2_12_FULL_60_25]|uniref:Phospho-N-acetylmuramoyl-pentapeptide-transferase n=1 Tax=Candidatus Uhrbacteria bacterium RIFCSPHIGHO2_12_FULL_60_25 TaxID=1802399 RepID=A0A1F7UIY1_9BACT|nr:MAG: phospho-N-acetylmuramoyl-pentapeptide-transferase [Candidatus Uhrbacteria bacterium RIFCSPHIGHO2_12_FULL_60_25]